MNKNKVIGILLSSLTLLSSCSSNNEEIEPIVEGNYLLFNSSSLVKDSYGGLGVEWGTYEDIKKLVPDAKSKILGAVDYINPSIVRCMFNYDWICENIDTKGDNDKSNDTWTYNFASEKLISCCEVLDYCQDHNIDVAFGGWNVIGNADPSLDQWGMMEDCTSDPRWAVMTADILSYLVKDKGYTCIKWFVNTNEPNWTGLVGSSKMAHNTFAKWSQGVRNVRAKLDEAGLNDIDIVGGDTTGFGEAAQEYMRGISSDLKDILHNYGAHFYIDNRSILQKNFQENLTLLYEGIKANDPALGASKKFYIWEAGLSTGKDSATDCNALIRNSSYGFMMADYTIQSILAGYDGVCYWDLDDAMHFMYSENGNTPKEWGMFSTLASAPIKDQDYRPWFYSTALLSNCLTKGSKVYKPVYKNDLMAIASTDANNNDGSVIIVNHGIYATDTVITLDVDVLNQENTYVYVYNDEQLELDANGHLKPSVSLNVSINSNLEITIPASSLVVISSKKIGG